MDHFNTKILPIPIRDYVDSICVQTDADPIMVTASLLGTISSYLNTGIYIDQPTYFQKLYPNLWMLSVSPSGTFKTTALNMGAKIAIEDDALIDQKIMDMKCQSDMFYSKNDSINTNQNSKNKLEINKLKKQRRLLPDKVTPEGLLEVLAIGQKGLILISEFGPWLKNMEKKSNTDLKGQLTHFYDVPYSYNYTTKSKGELIITLPFISIVAVSTMVWLEKNIHNEDFSSGFLARFLLFSPNQQQTTPPALPPINDLNFTDGNALRDILRTAPKDREYIIEGNAKEYFETVHNSLYDISYKLPIYLQVKLEPHLKRWSPYILKVAMIFQFVNDSYEKKNYSYKDSAFLKNTKYYLRPILKDSIEAAYYFVQYAIKSTIHLYSDELGESGHQKKCKKILKYIAKKGGLVTRQELLSSHTLEGGYKEYDYILDTLRNQGKINCQEKKPLTLSEISLTGQFEKFEKN